MVGAYARNADHMAKPDDSDLEVVGRDPASYVATADMDYEVYVAEPNAVDAPGVHTDSTVCSGPARGEHEAEDLGVEIGRPTQVLIAVQREPAC